MNSKKYNVLVVDDEHAMRALLAVMLEQEGFNVFEAANGNEARRVWTKEPAIDLMVADIWLPDTSGADLASELRAIRPHAKVLFISGMNPPPSHRISRLIGESELLTKPFTSRSLCEAVKRALNER
jgi:DNA-binding NtrC family response regulator